MPYYLAPYIGSGTALDSFRPRASDGQAWSAIDLRPDGGATLDGGGLNACLLYLPVHDTDNQLVQIADDALESLSTQRRNALSSRLNLTELTETRWDRIVQRLLMFPPANAWKPSRAGRRSKKYIVSLGPLHIETPILAGGTDISENWSCGDSSTINCQLNWVEEADIYAILSQQLRVTTSTGIGRMARADSALSTDDHFAQATIVSSVEDGPAGGNIVSVMARKDNTATKTFYFYRLVHLQQQGINDHRLMKIVGGAESQLGSTDPTDYAAGEIIRIECDGDQITGLRNGSTSVAPVTDSAIAGNLYTGVYCVSQATNGTIDLDDFSAGDLTAGPLVAAGSYSSTYCRPRLRAW